jgi:uncharacterized membrane protein HdeD (DUF308 family)
MKIAGVIFIIAGVLAIASPFTAGIALELLYGGLLVVSGAAHALDTFRTRSAENWIGHVLLAIVFILGGVLLLIAPAIGVLAATLLIAMAFIVQGVLQLGFGLSGRAPGNWIWVLASGALGVATGVLILLHWPSSAFWVVGVLAGVNLILFGVALMTTRVVVVETG